MAEQSADGPRRRDLRKTGRDLLRSLLAGIVGIVPMGGLPWLVRTFLHPPMGWIAWCALVPGYLTGLVACRWAGLTAGVAAGLLYGGLAIALKPDSERGNDLDGLAVIGAYILGSIGGGIGGWARGKRSHVAIGLGVLSAVSAVVMLWPEISLRRGAARFFEMRRDEVAAVMSEQLVREPTTDVEWRYEPVGGYKPGVALSAEWRVNTEAAGPGDCMLRVRTWGVFLEGELDRAVHDAQFRFTPHGAARLRAAAEAMAPLRDLGLRRLPHELKGTAASGWQGFSAIEHKGPWQYRVTVQQGGEVHVIR